MSFAAMIASAASDANQSESQICGPFKLIEASD
jgi:hypothetical protein